MPTAEPSEYELPSVAQEEQGPLTISVVIPAFNEEANLPKTLKALCKQTLPRESFEVIVVDNGSTDGTVETANRYAKELTLRLISRPRCNISEVRNHGAGLARGAVLAFLDADCVARPTWLENALALMPENSVWGAHYLVPENSTWVGRVWAKYQAVEREGLVSFIPGSNLFIKRADFERIGGFDASLKTSEDVEICNRASKHGMELVAYRMLAVFHEGTPQTLHGFYRQNRWHGESVARIFLANLPSMNNVHIVALSVYTLLAFWATVIVAPLELLHHRPWTAAVALLLLLLPALLLALQKTARAGGWRDMPALSALYFIYLLARAASLTKLSGRSHR